MCKSSQDDGLAGLGALQQSGSPDGLAVMRAERGLGDVISNAGGSRALFDVHHQRTCVLCIQPVRLPVFVTRSSLVWTFGYELLDEPSRLSIASFMGREETKADPLWRAIRVNSSSRRLIAASAPGHRGPSPHTSPCGIAPQNRDGDRAGAPSRLATRRSGRPGNPHPCLRLGEPVSPGFPRDLRLEPSAAPPEARARQARDRARPRQGEDLAGAARGPEARVAASGFNWRHRDHPTSLELWLERNLWGAQPFLRQPHRLEFLTRSGPCRSTAHQLSLGSSWAVSPAGWPACWCRAGGFGIIGDIVIGIVGAIIAGYLLPAIGISLGAGIIAAIIDALIGAVVLLLIIRLVRRAA